MLMIKKILQEKLAPVIIELNTHLVQESEELRVSKGRWRSCRPGCWLMPMSDPQGSKDTHENPSAPAPKFQA